MEYIGKNLKNNDCVIVGIHNALLWLKKKVSYEKIEYFARNYYEYTPEAGFDCGFLKDFMDCWYLPFNPYGGQIEDLEKQILEGNGALAILIPKNGGMNHMIFLKPNVNSVEIVNSNLAWEEVVSSFKDRQVGLSVWTVGKAA